MSTCKHYCVTCGKHADVDGLICGDCGEESVAAHAQQLAAERAKVARECAEMAQEVIKNIDDAEFACDIYGPVQRAIRAKFGVTE